MDNNHRKTGNEIKNSWEIAYLTF